MFFGANKAQILWVGFRNVKELQILSTKDKFNAIPNDYRYRSELATLTDKLDEKKNEESEQAQVIS